MESQPGAAAPNAPVPAPAPSATAPHRSPKRVRLSPAQKAAVCELLAGGARPDYIVDTFGIAKRTVFKIQRAQRLAQAAQNGQALADTAKKDGPATAAVAAAVAAAQAGAKLPENQNIVAPGTHPGTHPHGSPTQILENPGQALGNGSSAQLAQSIVAEAGQMTDETGALLAGTAEAGAGGASVNAANAARQPPKKPSPPAKRVRLNVSEKLEICNFVQAGGTPHAVINKYGISRRTFFKILHDEECIRQTVNREHVSAETKSIRPPHFPRLDQALSAFVLSARAARVPLNWHMVREQALTLRSELLASGKERPERVPHLERFTASEHWCQLFMRKNANKKLPSAVEDPAPARRQVAKETKNLQAQLGRYDAENIYTLITPRLFYRYTPPNFFGEGGVKKEERPKEDVNEETNEPYITLLIAANMSGTKRLPITIIVPPNVQKTFETRKPCLGYQCRVMQRCDSVAFDHWMRECFAPFVMANNANKVALVLEESIALSSSFIDTTEQISFLSVPRACMSMQESVKNGVFPVLVARYRFKLYELYNSLVPLRKELRESSENVPKQFRGLAEGCDATIWDAAQILNDAWIELSAERICRCWWRHNILPHVLESQLEAMHGEATDVPTIHEVSNFVLHMARSNGLGKGQQENVFPQGHLGTKSRWMTVVEIIRWFTYEYQHVATSKPEQPPENGLDWSEPPVVTDVSGDIMEEGSEARKWTPEEFVDAMKNFGNLEKSMLDIKDSEALNCLRASKQASLSNFVSHMISPPKPDPVVPNAAQFQNLSPPKQDSAGAVGNVFPNENASKPDSVGAVANFSFPNVSAPKQDISSGSVAFPFTNVGATKPDNSEQ